MTVNWVIGLEKVTDSEKLCVTVTWEMWKVKKCKNKKCVYCVSIININLGEMLASTESVQLSILETPTLNHPIMSFKHACRKMSQPLKSNSSKIVANLIQHQKPLDLSVDGSEIR